MHVCMASSPLYGHWAAMLLHAVLCDTRGHGLTAATAARATRHQL